MTPPVVTISEVGPRDGLQNEEIVLPPQVRAELVNRLIPCGFRRIEFGSFVRADRVPAMADADIVLDGIQASDDVELTALVLNRRGAERALAAGVQRLNYAVVATETFNRRNQGASLAESLSSFEEIAALARTSNAACTATIGASFGCPFEGDVPVERVVAIAGALTGSGADEIVLADTIGVGVPRQVTELVTLLQSEVGPPRIGLHLHDTRNTGVANALAAVDLGVDLLDASLGGAGGCPFAPNATGNLPTEDIVYALEESGLPTGINLDRLLGAVTWLEGHLGKRLPGKVSRAGGRPSGTGGAFETDGAAPGPSL